ncbi:MAG: ribbon-helix-helix protein, CopG family [Myxococcota bacterium]
MAKTTTKVAVSLPDSLFRAVERARRSARKSRSAVVQEALRDWLRRGIQADLVREYEAGYAARPERAADVEEALAIAVAAVEGDEEDW